METQRNVWPTSVPGRFRVLASDLELIPLTIPELLRLLRGPVMPDPRRAPVHRHHWSAWRRHHQYRARQAHQRWNAYAEAAP